MKEVNFYVERLENERIASIIFIFPVKLTVNILLLLLFDRRICLISVNVFPLSQKCERKE